MKKLFKKEKNLNSTCHCEGFSPWQSDEIASHSFTMTEQHGRSMVEMLGVLAVIGVLSVAGIAGYTTAMQSYRTNEILNATSMFYVLAMSQNQGNGPSGKIDYSNVGGTNPSGATLEYENNVITITFTDTKDCTSAKNKLGDKATDDCTNKKLTVTFGENTSPSVADDDPSTAGFYEGQGCYEGDCSNCISYYILENGNYKYIRNYGCPSGYGCNENITTPRELSSLAEAKESICFKFPVQTESEFDPDEWNLCDGGVYVDGPSTSCVGSLEEATEFCRSIGSGDASVVSDGEKKNFSC